MNIYEKTKYKLSEKINKLFTIFLTGMYYKTNFNQDL